MKLAEGSCYKTPRPKSGVRSHQRLTAETCRTRDPRLSTRDLPLSPSASPRLRVQHLSRRTRWHSSLPSGGLLHASFASPIPARSAIAPYLLRPSFLGALVPLCEIFHGGFFYAGFAFSGQAGMPILQFSAFFRVFSGLSLPPSWRFCFFTVVWVACGDESGYDLWLVVEVMSCGVKYIK